LSRRFGRQDGEKRLVWTITKELQLAVLIDGTERRDGRRAFAVLAQTLCPKLPPPGAHRVELVRIRPQHRLAHAALFRKRGMQRSASCGRDRRRWIRKRLCQHFAGTLAKRIDIEAHQYRRQYPDDGENRIAAPHAGRMVEDRRANRIRKILERALLGLSDRE